MSMSMEFEDGRLSIKEVAQEMNVSEKTVRRLIKGRRLPAIKFGKQYRIRREDLELPIEQANNHSPPESQKEEMNTLPTKDKRPSPEPDIPAEENELL